jgi:hypothetical protein
MHASGYWKVGSSLDALLCYVTRYSQQILSNQQNRRYSRQGPFHSFQLEVSDLYRTARSSDFRVSDFGIQAIPPRPLLCQQYIHYYNGLLSMMEGPLQCRPVSDLEDTSQ